AQPAFEPKAPERSPAPAVFKAWRHDKYSTMMMQAVLQDDAEALVWMLRHNLVDLAATDDLGNTAAHLAVFHDSPRSVQELISLGYDMSRPCDRFERTPEMVATRHDQGAALALVLRSLACLDIQRLARGFRGRQKAKRIKAAWARSAKKDAPEKKSVVGVDGAGEHERDLG
ncbi:unnamed protein product, partial [Hapterophycus canaliculatus]